MDDGRSIFVGDDVLGSTVEEASDDSTGRVSEVGLDEEIRVIRGFPRVDVRVGRGRALESHDERWRVTARS